MYTTLNAIAAKSPCTGGWKQLLRYLGKSHGDDEKLSLLTILDSNGIADTLWCIRAVEGYDREKRLFAVWCARQVQHLIKDPRSIAALDTAERFANGEATEVELRKAALAAYAATYVSAASAAASYAASAAASYAAYAAAASAAYAYAASMRAKQAAYLRELLLETTK